MLKALYSLLSVAVASKLRREKGNGISYEIMRASAFPLKPSQMQGNFGSIGEYYVTIYVNGKPYNVQLDTGSSDLGLYQDSCTSCGSHIHPFYTPSTANQITCSNNYFNGHPITCSPCTSKTYCDLSITYADASGYKAHLYTEKVSFDNVNYADAVVGGIYVVKDTKDMPFSPYEIDGIMGIGYSADSVSHTPTPFDFLIEAGKYENIFAICLAKISGGKFFLGADAAIFRSSNIIQWTPILSEDLYTVRIIDILFGKTSLGIKESILNKGGAIVDTGSSLISLPLAAYRSFKDFILNINFPSVNKFFTPAGNCVQMTTSDISLFPDLTIVMGNNVTISISSSLYIRNGKSLCGDDASDDFFALGVDQNAAGDGLILGDVFMQTSLIVFDRANRKIGFIENKNNDCSTFSSTFSSLTNINNIIAVE